MDNLYEIAEQYRNIAEMIEEAAGQVPAKDKAVCAPLAEGETPRAPGMKYRHYAPKAPVTIVSGPEDKVAEAIRNRADASTGILTVDEHVKAYPEGVVLSVGSSKAPETIIHNLFDVLRRFDETGVHKIYAEDLTKEDSTGAVMNRLLKSVGGNFVLWDEL